MPINNFKDDEEMKQGIRLGTVARLFTYLKPYRADVIRTLLLMGAVITVELLNPYFMKVGIDEFIRDGDWRGLLLLGAGMLALNAAALVCTRKRIVVMASMTNRILVTIRQNLYAHIQKMSFSFFDNRPIGKVLARIIGDVNSLSDLFTNSITNLVPEIFKITAVVAIMLTLNVRLAFAALATLPFLMGIMVFISRRSHKGWQVYRKKTSNVNAFTHEAFSGMRVIQGFAAEKTTSRAFRTLCGEWKDSFMRAVRYADFFWPSVEMSWGVGTIVVFAFGLRMLQTGSITIGLLVAFTSYVSMFWNPIMNISNFYNQLLTNMTSAERIFEILDIQPDIADEEGSSRLPPVTGAVSFRNVTFGYSHGTPVLSNVSFAVRPGETIALVGPTGVGKTTIVNLISRFYEAQSGEVLIDGQDVRSVTIESLRSQLGIMMQDTFLFSGTIRDNIRYGRLDATDEEIEEAARAVHAHDFIARLEKGYDTGVHERGTRLSAGQRQLIAFARVLLSDPKILILDEATASIDTHTEILVQEGIRKLLDNRTSFVIAHRLSTIQSADRILVIENGQISEDGSHEELIGREGLYKDLFTAQFRFLGEIPAVG
ncbi:MAG: ABC transporter ATP-binding protein [Saccharofermentanales bacterium]